MPDLSLILRLLPGVFTHLVGFFIFLWLLKRYALGPVLQLLDERREKIAKEFDQIAAAEKRNNATRDEYEKKLREIDDEARRRALEEISKAKRSAEEITEKARVEATEIIEKAKANVQMQIDQARAELKEEIITLALSAAERLIHEKMNDTKHRELVNAFIGELERKN
jgi:F-type H+-transporting ATPase subunit b